MSASAGRAGEGGADGAVAVAGGGDAGREADGAAVVGAGRLGDGGATGAAAVTAGGVEALGGGGAAFGAGGVSAVEGGVGVEGVALDAQDAAMDAAVGTGTGAGCAVDDGTAGSAETLGADRSGTPDGSPSLNSEYPSPASSKTPTDTANHRPTHHPAFILNGIVLLLPHNVADGDVESGVANTPSGTR